MRLVFLPAPPSKLEIIAASSLVVVDIFEGGVAKSPCFIKRGDRREGGEIMAREVLSHAAAEVEFCINLFRVPLRVSLSTTVMYDRHFFRIVFTTFAKSMQFKP